MADKSDKSKESRILLLQNIILNASTPLTNKIESQNKMIDKNGLIYKNHSKENYDPKVNNAPKSRYTASSYIFDEEPFFSDSDEEKEYCELITTQKSLDYMNQTSESSSVAVQCNLNSEELELVDIVQKCASINREQVDENFKELIDLCKQIQFKGKHFPLPLASANKEVLDIPTKDNELNGKEPFIASNNSPNVPQLIPISNVGNRREEFFSPSTNGDSCSSSRSDGFSSEKYNFDSGVSNIYTFKKPTMYSGTKKRVLRRSDRIRKISMPVNAIDLRRALHINSIKNKKETKEIISAREVKDKRGSVKLPTNNTRTVVTLEKPIQIGLQIPFLSKEQTKSLARCWMKPNKPIMKNCTSGSAYELPSLRNRHKSRCLYSPNRWMHSEILMDLCEAEERCSF